MIGKLVFYETGLYGNSTPSIGIVVMECPYSAQGDWLAKRISGGGMPWFYFDSKEIITEEKKWIEVGKTYGLHSPTSYASMNQKMF